jgi:putative oxidoreductase
MTIEEMRQWFLDHRSWCMDLVRIYLGVGLFAKGLAFLVHREELVQTMIDHDIMWSGMALAHVVILTHIFGGLLMAVGIGTRIGALIQIPILVGATFFVNWSGGLWGFAEELRFSALVLFLLIMFVWYGAGPLSLEARMQRAGDAVPDVEVPRRPVPIPH